MIYILDTFYFEQKAHTACLGIEDWMDSEPKVIYCDFVEGVEEYKSGSFYQRELPCIISMMMKIDLKPDDVIVVDGFVVLDDYGKNGLGGYLYEHYNGEYAVVGVAKNDYVSLDALKRIVMRGESKKPLYITAKGINLDYVHDKIVAMHGDYRIPTILKMVDAKSREILI